MLVTINTDASWCSETKAAGFAFWIVCDAGRIKFADKFRKKCSSSDMAESKCILNALFALFKQKHWPKPGKVIINTDSLNAWWILTNNRKQMKKWRISVSDHAHLWIEFEKYKKQNDLIGRIEFRHVKAHNDTDSPRTFVNDWCDEQAKTHMRKRREELKLNNACQK